MHVESGSTDALHVWFARLARVTPWTVTRWLNGKRQFRGAALSLLEQLEQRASSAVPSATKKAR